MALPHELGLVQDGPERDFYMHVEREKFTLRVREEARKQLARESQPPRFLPDVHLLEEFLAVDDPPVAYTIRDLMPLGTHGIIAAQYKAGKSTLTANLIRALADQDPFLGQFEVHEARDVTLIDNELDDRTLRRWLRSQGIKNTGRVRLVSLRGSVSTFDLIDEETRHRWAAHLSNPGVVILDCLRPVLDAIGLDENREAGRFLTAFDEFLQLAGAEEAMVVHHMGHNSERSRGDSRLQDWPDVTWKLVRKTPDDPASPRYFTAYGRDVDVPEGRLEYDEATRRLTLTLGNRKQSRHLDRVEELVAEVVQHVTANPGQTKNKIEAAFTARAVDVREALQKAVEQGLIEERQRRARGGGKEYHPTGSEPRPNLVPEALAGT